MKTVTHTSQFKSPQDHLQIVSHTAFVYYVLSLVSFTFGLNILND